MTFGEYFKAARIKFLGITLRQFCRQNGLNVSLISCVERGLVGPPNAHTLMKYADALCFTKGSDARREFFDLAEVARGRIPAGPLSDAELMGKLPAILTEIQRKHLDGPGLDKLIELIREA